MRWFELIALIIFLFLCAYLFIGVVLNNEAKIDCKDFEMAGFKTNLSKTTFPQTCYVKTTGGWIDSALLDINALVVLE